MGFGFVQYQLWLWKVLPAIAPAKKNCCLVAMTVADVN
jgi:hypothetical protein